MPVTISLLTNSYQSAKRCLSVAVSLLTDACQWLSTFPSLVLTFPCQWLLACWRKLTACWLMSVSGYQPADGYLSAFWLMSVSYVLYNLLTNICKPADRRLSVAISLLTESCQPADWCLSVTISLLTDICQPVDWCLSVGKRRPCFVWLGHKAVPPLYRLYTCWFFSWQTIRVVKGTFTQINDK